VEIVELVGAISLFGFLNRWNATLGTPLEEGPGAFSDSLTYAAGEPAPAPGTASRSAPGRSPSPARTDQTCRVDSLIFVSGQLALDGDGALVGNGDARVQADQCLRNISDALAAHGASLGDVVKLTCYLVDGADYPAYAAAKADILPVLQASSTTVIVRDLLVTGALLEVEAIAVDPAGPDGTATEEQR